MSPLETMIREEIGRNGPMDLARYMDLCLGHPEHGYYMTRDPFGTAGDFTTAPEISQLFGEMIGAWLAHQWLEQGAPPRITLVEAGPGRGTLMADILRATRGVPGFHAAVSVHLLEISPALKKKQQESLQGYEVCWHDDLDSIPDAGPLFFVANEFLDALPIHQLVWTGAWQERCVGIDKNDTLCFTLNTAPELLVSALPAGLPSPEIEDIIEISPSIISFLKKLTQHLEKQSGCGLIIDYGYGQSAYGDSLQALYQHQSVSIFDHMGAADLTAHVNFEQAAGLLPGAQYMTQGAFLKGLGIDIRAQKLMEQAGPAQARDILSGLHRLTAPEQMGRLFKVLTFESRS